MIFKCLDLNTKQKNCSIPLLLLLYKFCSESRDRQLLDVRCLFALQVEMKDDFRKRNIESLITQELGNLLEELHDVGAVRTAHDPESQEPGPFRQCLELLLHPLLPSRVVRHHDLVDVVHCLSRQGAVRLLREKTLRDDHLPVFRECVVAVLQELQAVLVALLNLGSVPWYSNAVMPYALLNGIPPSRTASFRYYLLIYTDTVVILYIILTRHVNIQMTE